MAILMEVDMLMVKHTATLMMVVTVMPIMTAMLIEPRLNLNGNLLLHIAIL